MLAELERKAMQQKSGLVSPFDEHARRALVEHLDEFLQSLRDAGNTEEHCQLIGTRVRHIVTSCRFRFIAEISASKVLRCLADLKSQKKRSQQTVNHYLRAIKQFTRWLVRDHRTDEDRLTFLQGGNVKTDRRLERRELNELEIQYLLQTAQSGGTSSKLTGWQRYTLYATALATGLRASELASLTPRHFELDAEVPLVHIKAKNEKARRGDVIPLPPELVTVMRSWFPKVPADAQLWPGKWAAQKQAGKFIQKDLETARIQWLADAATESERDSSSKSATLLYKNDTGQADFHALRHTYLSRLGRSGVSAKAMQKLARHSTVELTIGRYTHANLNDLGAAVRQMSPLPLSAKANSGTSNDESSESDSDLVALMVAGFSDNHCQSLKTIDESTAQRAEEPLPNVDSRNPHQTKVFEDDCGCLIAFDKAERGGFEPPRPLRACRFSRPVHSTALPSLRAGGSLGVARGSNKEIALVKNLWQRKTERDRRPAPSPEAAGATRSVLVADARTTARRRRR